MTEAEKAAALADEIEAEMNELRGRFANRENDHFSFGLKFSSWDTIARALRLLAEQPAVSPASAREVVNAIFAKAIAKWSEKFDEWSSHDDSAYRDRVTLAASRVVGAEEIALEVDAAISAIQRDHVILPREPTRKYALGDRVTKPKGASWTGRVVGYYSTELTPIGYAVESENEPGSVQIYPETALAAKE